MASTEARAMALAWCARILSASKDLEFAESLCEIAETTATCPEVIFAKAFILLKREGVAAALNHLSGSIRRRRTLPA